MSTAGAGTLAMARKLQPTAITLDLGLADIDGFVLLDLLKHDPRDRAMFRSTSFPAPTGRQSAMGMGAFGVTEKPAERAELVRVFKALREEPTGKKPRRKAQGRPPTASRARPCPSLPAPRC